MNWKETVKNVIVYIESHIYDVININEIAKKLFISPFYLQKGFKLMTGYTISDYINYSIYNMLFKIIQINRGTICQIKNQYISNALDAN